MRTRFQNNAVLTITFTAIALCILVNLPPALDALADIFASSIS